LRLVVPGRRGRQGLGGLALAALAALVAGCGGGHAEPRQAPTPRGGLAIGLVEPNANLLWSRAARPDLAAGFGPWRDRVEALRPAYYRLVIDWAKVQPDAGRPPAWDQPQDGCMRGIGPCGSFAGVRDILRAVRSEQDAHGGWEVSVLIYGAPQWAARGPGGCERSTATGHARPLNDAGLKAYRELVRSLLALGRSTGVALRWWSPWNEPNHPAFISPQRARCDASAPPVAPQTYATLARAMRAELDAAPGDQWLILGDFAGLPRSSDKSETIGEFLRALPDDVVCSAAAWATHSYAVPGRPHGTAAADAVGDLERALAGRACSRGKPVYVTETGVGAPHAGDNRPRGASALRAGCRAMSEQLALWHRDPRVAAAFQYTFRDDPLFPVGLADPQLQTLWPAYDVWKGYSPPPPAKAPAPPVPAACG
jgi:hypothetical protein